MTKPRAILIAGPTASGKSRLAIELACRLNGTVINTDSMQIYSDLRIITARPTHEDEAAVPHRLFGYQDASIQGSVARWLEGAGEALSQCESAGQLPIFVGGTGLYFRALVEGLSNIPPVPDEIRTELRRWAVGRSAEEIHARLFAVDPSTAVTLRPSDPQRNLRALEILVATGRPLSSFHSDRAGALLSPDACLAVFLAPDRDLLRDNINTRFDVMLREGAIDEVRRLKARHLDHALPAMRAHGVPALMQFLDGNISLEEAAEIGKADTRRYAKRQHTWFRHQAPWFQWITPSSGVAHVFSMLETD